ncbi:hypothetical protein [Streptomyces hydrogenans]|nr:hypothetical protein [Streptomyces hydrogenans]GHG09871.1 hypothetical protein GCM10018784_23140 [Streptomyces hydrogenans]
MTDAEFEQAMAEAREHVRRTSFPAPRSEEEREYAPHGHAEYGEARH